ncbi:hypothetical protein [Glutamicibacter sp. NPDC087344]|uniref:hypothetical protein n=1 Tax=Glutamicibacter sp. NPDC087344 TaxID=3363994 RepID=UPI00381C2410
MAIFNKLLNKGKQLAGDFVREQMNQGSSQGNQNQQRASQQGAQRGYENQNQYAQPQQTQAQPSTQGNQAVSREDQAAIEKYRYMLRTAPPQDMERAHAEAFARLTVQQRELLHNELSAQLPPAERPATGAPQDLARAATRAEVSRPGFMERILGQGGGRKSMGGLAAGAGGLGIGLLGGVAGAFIGTAIAGPLLDGFAGIGEDLGSMADGLGDTVAGAGEQLSAAGEGLGEQAGGLFDGLLGGAGDIFGSDSDFTDFKF